jgi:hypothetical protein
MAQEGKFILRSYESAISSFTTKDLLLMSVKATLAAGAATITEPSLKLRPGAIVYYMPFIPATVAAAGTIAVTHGPAADTDEVTILILVDPRDLV